MTVPVPRKLALGALIVMAALVPGNVDARLFGSDKKKIERIEVALPVRSQPVATPRPAPPLTGRSACVDVRRVAAAQVFGDTAVELTVQGGRRWRMYFDQTCPALSFYDGFYYRRAEQGRLCAGRDAIIARSGGECAIASIVAIKPLRRKSRNSRR